MVFSIIAAQRLFNRHPIELKSGIVKCRIFYQLQREMQN